MATTTKTVFLTDENGNLLVDSNGRPRALTFTVIEGKSLRLAERETIPTVTYAELKTYSESVQTYTGITNTAKFSVEDVAVFQYIVSDRGNTRAYITAQVSAVNDTSLTANGIGISVTGADGKNGNDGVTPRIGDNKHWYIGEEDTGIVAEGKNGTTPHIGENKHWYIGETDTGILAEGKDGATPEIGENGNWYINGEDTGKLSRGATGATGANGQNGATPEIGENGNWFVNGEDTGKSSKGAKGDNGTTFTPSVDTNGNLSWTNDGGLPNPTTVNIKGQKGDTGLAATIQIGTVTTLPAGSQATAENVGTDTDAIINLGIPQGAQGEKGGTYVAQIQTSNGEPLQVTAEQIAQNTEFGIGNAQNWSAFSQEDIALVNVVVTDNANKAALVIMQIDAPPTSTLITGRVVYVQYAASSSGGGSTGGGLNATEISLESTKDINKIYSTIKTLSETQKIVSILNGRYTEGGVLITAVKDGATKKYTMFAPLLSWSNSGELEITGILVEGAEGSGTPTGILNQATLVYYSSTANPTLIRSGISFEDHVNDILSEITATMLSSTYPIIVYSQEA